MAGLIDRVGQLVELDTYEKGYIAALLAYAHMIDGTYYVGTTGRTLDDAIRRFMSDRDKPLPDEPEEGWPTPAPLPADYWESAE